MPPATSATKNPRELRCARNVGPSTYLTPTPAAHPTTAHPNGSQQRRVRPGLQPIHVTAASQVHNPRAEPSRPALAAPGETEPERRPRHRTGPRRCAGETNSRRPATRQATTGSRHSRFPDARYRSSGLTAPTTMITRSRPLSSMSKSVTSPSAASLKRIIGCRPVVSARRAPGRVRCRVRLWERNGSGDSLADAVRRGQTQRSCSARMRLTCRNGADQLTCRAERSVRDEEAAGSNPATPTQVRGHLRSSRMALSGAE